MSEIIGKTISHYLIIEEIGRGGMGVVYKAEDTKLKRNVALKFLPKGLEAHEPERARFLQEAQATAVLNHPNICTVHDIDSEGEQQFIVMEYIEGKTLRQMLPLVNLRECIDYAIQIGEALQEAHAKGVVHRDIKTDNIMINTKNQVKVMDFGLAKLKGSLKLTRTSSTVGTLAYMAPEQIQGGEVDARSDIFSFGIVLFEMLTGHLPFRGEHEAAMIYSIVNEEPEALEKYRSDTSEELRHVIRTVLEKGLDDRYQSAAEMVRDLRRIQKQSTRAVRPDIQEVSSPDSVKIPPQGERFFILGLSAAKKYWIAAFGILVVAGILAGLYWLIRSGTDRTPFQSMFPVRIATNGMVLSAVISPDGKYIAYASTEGGRQSLWLRQVSAASSVQIVAPADTDYYGLTFSPDGEYLYFVCNDSLNPHPTLFRIPALGGSPRRIIEDVYGGVGVSPDGKRIAFLRVDPQRGGDALMVCDADGSNLRKLASRYGNDFFIGTGGETPVWSRDGTQITCAAGSVSGGFHMTVIVVSLADGKVTPATPHRWSSVGRIAWLQDSKDIIAVAQELTSGSTMQLWYVPADGKPARRLTSDLLSYDPLSLSVTRDQSKLLGLQRNFNSSISILPGGDDRRMKESTARNSYLEGTGGFDWTLDGRLIFGSLEGGNWDIWSMRTDGSDRRQLTGNPYTEETPIASADGSMITYSSNRDSTPHVWCMDVDGNNQRQLTTGADDYNMRFSHDGKWIYFTSYRDQGKRQIWRIPSGGGALTRVSELIARLFDVSPDDKKLLVDYYDSTANRYHRGVMTVAEGRLVQTFDFSVTRSGQDFRWMPDGKGIACIQTKKLVSNIWVLPMAAGKLYQLTHFTSDLIFSMAWSKDSRNLAVVRGEVSSNVVLFGDLR